MIELVHDPQNCPNCGELVSPTKGLLGPPQRHGPYVVYIINVTCPECSGKWLTQIKEVET